MAKKSLTNIPGVFASGINCGIKEKDKDLAFIFVPEACASAGVFTQNTVCASSVSYSKSCFARGTVKAVVINSGNANAVTGARGVKDTKEMARLTAAELGLKSSEVAVSSTGIIGEPLPMGKVRAGIEKLLRNPQAKQGRAAADAILTTDLRRKEVFLSQKILGKEYIVAGIAKGSGMIAPNMATMLGYLVSNVSIKQAQFKKLFRAAVEDSFNMITVDSDTSTSDMVLAFATGERTLPARAVPAYSELLLEACTVLAKEIIKDGEGAEKLIEVNVQGAKTKEQARKAALNIVNSPLVKTAIHGADPNWGRVLMALGKDPSIKFNPNKVDLFFQKRPLLLNGEIIDYNRRSLAKLLEKKEVVIDVRLQSQSKGGQASKGHQARAWGCDLTKKYIDINTAYT